MRRSVVESRSGNLIASSINRLSSIVPPELNKILQPYLDPAVKKFNDRMGEPLPPPDPNQTSPWTFSQPVANEGRSTNAVQGQFELPISITNGAQGVQVNIDSQQMWNQATQAAQNRINDAFKNNSGSPPQR